MTAREYRRIQRLPEEVANQIAAGEVIERPASVVKELVENALDAGADRIEVEIKEGGKEYIRVTDNGWGIAADEAELAFERHATSKIRRADDLFAVQTLGFRGEALPSIAAVSEVEMRTRTRDADAGVLLRLEGGRLVERRPEGCPPGTTVVVRRLFFNTPARYRFLKSVQAERRHVVDWVGRLALAYPGSAFTLIAEGRSVFQTEGTGNVQDVLAPVFGRAAAEAMVPVTGESVVGAISGWVSRPEFHRGDRDMQVLVVNGRPVHAPALVRAAEKAYDTLLPSRRFPALVLSLTVDPFAVDVNVHPAKLEVKLAQEADVFRFVLHAVRAALTKANLYVYVPAPRPLQAPSPHVPRAQSWSPEPAAAGPRPSPVPAAPARMAWEWTADRAFHGPARSGQASAGEQAPPAGQASAEEAVPGVREKALAAGDARLRLRELHLLGYLDRMFLLGMTRGELWIVDMHVAHERLLYERLLPRLSGREGPRPPSQRLLHPILLELGAAEAVRVGDCLPALEAAGFSVAEFGPGAFRIDAVPVELAGVPLHELKDAVSEALREGMGPGDGRYHRGRAHDLAARMACRLAIKAGEYLPLEAARHLLRELADAENPFTCPHGRPIAIVLSRHELERRFGRH